MNDQAGATDEVTTEVEYSYPRPTGGGWYELSDGTSVQGKEAAESEEAKLSTYPHEDPVENGEAKPYIDDRGDRLIVKCPIRGCAVSTEWDAAGSWVEPATKEHAVEIVQSHLEAEH